MTYEEKRREIEDQAPKQIQPQDLLDLLLSGSRAYRAVWRMHKEVALTHPGFREYKELVESRGYVSMQDAWVQELVDREGDRIWYDEAYLRALKFILETWAFEQGKRMHVDPGPELRFKFGVTPQICVPGIRFPAGHYDFRGSLLAHPAIPITGSGESSRVWFWEEDADDQEIRYVTDRAWWSWNADGLPNIAPNSDTRPALIYAPHGIEHEYDGQKQQWHGRAVVVDGLNVRSMLKEPVVGMLVTGAQENMTVKMHFFARGRESVGFNIVPQSDPRVFHGYKIQQSWASYDPEEKNFKCHVADSDLDLFVENCEVGAYILGKGNRVSMRHYYGVVGVYCYGTPRIGPTGAGNRIESMCYSSEVGENAVSVIDSTGKSLVSSGGTVWSEIWTYPETVGPFKEGGRTF